MQYVLNYRVYLGDSLEYVQKMLSFCIQAQLYSSHHILCDTMLGLDEFITSSNHWALQGLGYRVDDD